MFIEGHGDGAQEYPLILVISGPDRNVVDGALPAMHATNRVK